MFKCNLNNNQAFDAAITSLDSLSEDDYLKSTQMMQLLRDNYVDWEDDSNEEAVEVPAETPMKTVECSKII